MRYLIYFCIAMLLLASLIRLCVAQAPAVLLRDDVAVTYCGGSEVVVNGVVTYVWPCVIFRDSFSSKELPRK